MKTSELTTLSTPRWTFTSDSCGYTLFKDGVPQGGGRTLNTATHTSDGRRRHRQHRKADIKMFRETAQRLCDQYNREFDQGESK